VLLNHSCLQFQSLKLLTLNASALKFLGLFHVSQILTKLLQRLIDHEHKRTGKKELIHLSLPKQGRDQWQDQDKRKQGGLHIL